MGGLRPGEIKILKSLEEGEKRYTDIYDEIGLHRTILSDYLKRLQKDHLITRDIDTRRYKLNQISLEVLFFNDVLDFMKKQLESMDKAGILHARLRWFIMTNNVEIRVRLREKIDNPKNLDDLRVVTAFQELYDFVENLWDSYVLSTFKEKNRKIIETYRRFLLRCVKELHSRRSEKEEKILSEFPIRIAEAKLASDFPGVTIPRKMVKIEATRRLKELEENEDKILQPYNLEDLYFKLNLMREQGKYRKDLTEKEINQLKEMHVYLTNVHNKQIYEKYLSKLNDCPKTLLVYPSWGFKGYLEKLKSLFPKAAERIEEEQMKMAKMWREM